MSLIERLEAAEAGSRELDAAIAIEVLGWNLWRSKHGHWHVNGPKGERFEHGEPNDWFYDPRTGEKFPEPLPPIDWVDRAEVGDFTSSLDASLALAERVLPGCRVMVERDHDGSGWACVRPREDGPAITSEATAPALALCIAILKAKEAS